MNPLASTFPRLMANERANAEHAVRLHLTTYRGSGEEPDHAALTRHYQLLADHHLDLARSRK